MYVDCIACMRFEDVIVNLDCAQGLHVLARRIFAPSNGACWPLIFFRWMEGVLNEELPPVLEFEEYLQNGVLLCRLAMKVLPDEPMWKKVYDLDLSKFKVQLHAWNSLGGTCVYQCSAADRSMCDVIVSDCSSSRWALTGAWYELKKFEFWQSYVICWSAITCAGLCLHWRVLNLVMTDTDLVHI